MNKKYFIIFIVLNLLFLIKSTGAFSGSGSGTLADPFVITNCTQLQEMNLSIAANYTLGNNIDCSDTINWGSGAGFSPITTTYAGRFLGSLKGQGYDITSLYINITTNNVGLFGYTGSSANITNFSMIGASITGGTYVGGFVAYSYGAVSFVYFEGNISSTGGEAGGIVGVNDGPISYCYAKGIFTATSSGMIGAIFGDSIDANSVVNDCYSEGSVSGAGQGVGGFSGRNYGTISNSYSKANATSTSTSIGGFVGTNYGTVSNSYSMGLVTGSNPYYTCGFADTSGTVSNCYHDSQTGLAYYTGSYCSRTEKTTAQMLTQSTYSGWDFTGIWNNDSDLNDGYPFLVGVGAVPPSGISLNILFPVDGGNYSDITTINYSVTSVGVLDQCWYSNSSGAWNSTTVTAGTNFTNVVSADGQNNFTVYCNISSNIGSSTTSFTIKRILLQLLSPTGNINAAQNQTFEVSVNVSCDGADCGEINVSLDPATDRTPRTCSEVWGASCVGSDPTTSDYSYDNCAVSSYYSTGFWVDEVTVDATTVAIGDTITITCTFNCYSTSNLNDLAISYYNGTWNQIWSQDASCVDGNYSTTVVVNGDVGEQKVRCQIGYTVSNPTGTCFTTTLSDNDDVNFTVITAGKGGLVSMSTSATPFYTTTQNPYNTSLNDGESEVITWTVNATGAMWGNYTFFAYANVTSDMTIGNATQMWNVTIVNSTVDSTSPTINITYPANNTNYTINISSLNYTVSDDVSVSGCWYSADSGQTNSTTVAAETNFTNVISTEEWNTWTIYCNDTSNNIGSNLVIFYKDTILPVFNNLSNQTLQYKTDLGYIINATDSSGIDCFTVNDTTNFNINCSGYLRNNTLLNVGLYWLNITVNDTLGNRDSALMWVNITDTTAPIVTLNTPATNYTNDSAIQINITFNCSATDNVALTNISLYITNNLNTSFSLNQTTIVSGTSNSTNWILGLGNGNYTWNCLAYDSSGNNAWGSNNRSITLNFTDIDNDNVADSQDSLEGNESNVNVTGVSNLNITIGGNSTYGSYADTHDVVFYDSATKIINLTHNFSASELDLRRVSISKSTNWIIVNLSGQVQSNYNKTLYIDDNSFASLCVKDAEIISISEMSSGCNGANETDLTSCLGNGATINGINCVDKGNIIQIGNLRYSAIRGTPTTPPSSSPSYVGGGDRGGGGSITTDELCKKNEDCEIGYSCYKNKCVKLFDIEIIRVDPLINSSSFELKYFIKGMADIKGDIIIRFWIENTNGKIMLGQDAIYLGSFEEKTKTTQLNLPNIISNETYDLYVEVNYEDYYVKSFRKINIKIPEDIVTGEESAKELKKAGESVIGGVNRLNLFYLYIIFVLLLILFYISTNYRKILNISKFLRTKSSDNLLDRVPLRRIEYEIDPTTFKVTLLVPRFHNPIIKILLGSWNRGLSMRINLDEPGSFLWLKIDGKKNLYVLSEQLRESFGGRMETIQEFVVSFVRTLEQYRFIKILNGSSRK